VKVENNPMTKEERREYCNQCAKKHYYEKVKGNADELSKRAEYHAKWQRENKDRWNAYRNEYRRRKRLLENEVAR
jgi:hypothetical protein